MIFLIRRFVGWRQAMGHSTKSGVMAAALQDASNWRMAFMTPMRGQIWRWHPSKSSETPHVVSYELIFQPTFPQKWTSNVFHPR